MEKIKFSSAKEEVDKGKKFPLCPGVNNNPKSFVY